MPVGTGAGLAMGTGESDRAAASDETRRREVLAIAAPLAIYFGAMHAVNGAALPYLNVWLASTGLSLGEIAVIATVAPVVRMICGPVSSLVADMTQSHRLLLIAFGWAWFASWVLLANTTTFQVALVAQVLISAAAAGLSPLIEAIAVSSVRTRGIDYGRVRVWGSITFILASLAGGWLVDWRGIGVVIWLLVVGALATALAGHLVPRAASGIASGRRIGWADTLSLVQAPVFLTFLLAAGLVQAGHATLYTFSVIHWQAQGLSNTWCGALWAIGVIAEIVLFTWSAKLFRGWSPVTFLLAGAIAGALRWALMAFDPPLALLIPLQVLHGLTFGASHIGAIQFLARAVPDGQGGTAQGLYMLVTSGIFMAVATGVAGLAYTRYGGMAYLPMAVLSAAGALAFVALERMWRGGVIGAVAGAEHSD